MSKRQREVTERDFRAPEYLDAKVDEYEWREDGKLVRKDRWITGIRQIVSAVRVKRDYEIPDVVAAVEKMAFYVDHWEDALEDAPSKETDLTVRMDDDSILHDVSYDRKNKTWSWRGFNLDQVVSWRSRKEIDSKSPDQESV